MRNTSSWKKILVLVVILMVPGFLYYLLQEKGKNRYRPLNIYGPKELSGTFHTKRGKKIADTTYHQIRDFKLIDQQGKEFSFPLDSTKITIFNFFFTRCSSFCKQMNGQMDFLADKYNDNRMLRFCSVSVDPEYDSPEVLAKYAQSFHANPKKWFFLTGNKGLIFDLAKRDFLVDAYKDHSDTSTIVHSPMLILVDPQKRIRGYYDSDNKEQMSKLDDEIKVLIVEELRKVTDR